MKIHYHLFTRATVITATAAIICICTLALYMSQIGFRLPQFKTHHTNENSVAATHQSDAKFINNMELVFAVGKEVGEPEALQAILLQETNGGRSILVGNLESPVGKRSYGVMQVQVIAARSVFENYPVVANMYFPKRKYASITDEEIITLLLSDNEACVRVAAYHLKYYKSLVRGDLERALLGYNAGIRLMHNMSNPSEFDYVIGIKTKLDQVVRPFNRTRGLQLTQRF